MALFPLFDTKTVGRPMRVAAFMSGSGTNIRKLLERERELENRDGYAPFTVIFIFSDRSDGLCQGERLAYEFGIPYVSYDIRMYHTQKRLKRTILTQEGLDARKAFDTFASRFVKAFEIDVIALGGYMSYTTLDRCINVHPADLSILNSDGTRKYVGDQAVMDAIAAGETTIRASTLWTDEGVDTGPLLMVSDPLPVVLPEPLESLMTHRERFTSIVKEHQERLKASGDWKIFPRTVEMIAEGRFAVDENNQMCADGKPVPKGYRE